MATRIALGSALAVVLALSTFTFASSRKIEHVDQRHLADLVRSGKGFEAFSEAFEAGDELFSHEFSEDEGVGANVGDGTRLTTIPRADLNGPGQWANHIPSRSTGPNATSCVFCHSQPFEDGASATVEIRDPYHRADPAYFIRRNTTPLFGLGGLQRLGEEMTEELHDRLETAKKQACNSGGNVRYPVMAKGVCFGEMTVIPEETRGGDCEARLDYARLKGIDPDLVVRPFQWKGSVAFIRNFNRDAAHNELGVQGVELVGDAVDGDYDQTKDELSVGDVTAITIYNAAQPRPTTRVELARLGLIPKLDRAELRAIRQGETLFKRVGCAQCHKPQMTLTNPIFSEPSQSAHFRDRVFPGGQDPIARFVDPGIPITFDLTRDQPDNHVIDPNGQPFLLGAFEKDARGHAIVRLYSDLRKHDMGSDLAESIEESGFGGSFFMTRPIWGVGSTAPYLHDGRAKTLESAISFHGGEALQSRASFNSLKPEERQSLITFLKNLVLFKTEEEHRGVRSL